MYEASDVYEGEPYAPSTITQEIHAVLMFVRSRVVGLHLYQPPWRLVPSAAAVVKVKVDCCEGET